MKSQKKVKFLLFISVLVVAALLFITVYQVISISKTKKEITNQKEQIEQLEEELEYYKNKLPNSDYTPIT